MSQDCGALIGGKVVSLLVGRALWCLRSGMKCGGLLKDFCAAEYVINAQIRVDSEARVVHDTTICNLRFQLESVFEHYQGVATSRTTASNRWWTVVYENL